MTLGKTLFSQSEIQRRVGELAAQISLDYKGSDLLAVCVLKGACMFFADLIRMIDLQLITIEFIALKSYIKDTSSGDVRLLYDTLDDIKGRDVLIIEDIIDTGLTIQKTIDIIKGKSPNTLKICALLNKRPQGGTQNVRRKIDVTIDYIGFNIPDKFVVGYGLDYQEMYRNLSEIRILDI